MRDKCKPNTAAMRLEQRNGRRHLGGAGGHKWSGRPCKKDRCKGSRFGFESRATDRAYSRPGEGQGINPGLISALAR